MQLSIVSMSKVSIEKDEAHFASYILWLQFSWNEKWAQSQIVILKTNESSCFYGVFIKNWCLRGVEFRGALGAWSRNFAQVWNFMHQTAILRSSEAIPAYIWLISWILHFLMRSPAHQTKEHTTTSRGLVSWLRFVAFERIDNSSRSCRPIHSIGA